jgi:hypothetical protein
VFINGDSINPALLFLIQKSGLLVFFGRRLVIVKVPQKIAFNLQGIRSIG